MQLCLKCCGKVFKYRANMSLWHEHKLKNKPKRPIFCLSCRQYKGMDGYFLRRRMHINEETGQERQAMNCIVPCGYGMFAPKSYKIAEQRG